MTTRTTIPGPRTKTKKKSSLRAGAWLLGVFALAAALSFSVTRSSWGQGAAPESKKVPKLRTVEGMVCRDDGKPVQGAVVYLQDSKSLQVKSYLSDDKGEFHFRRLSMSADFDLWAELNGKRSKTKSISQFNSKTELQIRLKVPIAD